ncbi:hypothetical protein FisN_18Lh208 [Fistulifera solaris]|uniref:Uncharacterized protein n=1 Tax=Fistulifera solaris TaxID=1519565 RepID=A0A1Z5JUV2_FISSO|nr:hypothetical protein FisN_18Lh208 [Fistulifera solaris]|eukprot:GAX17558.1 hypothetical protein FisN_18Lh208 [Fistulifera solaris]
MPRPPRKATTPKSNSQKLDTFHNRFDQPCSRLLQEIKDEIVKPKVVQESNLASAIRHYLQTEVVASSASVLNGQTEKRKKKKKKKKASCEEKRVDEIEENDVESTEVIAQAVEASTDSKEDVPPSVKRSSRRRCLLRNLLAKSMQNLPVIHRSPSSSLRLFLEYMTEKQMRCQLLPDKLQQAVNDIACESCRKVVQEHLMKNSMLILHFGGIEDDRTDAHFDYVAMEEGLGQEKERWYFVRDLLAPSQSRGSESKDRLDGLWELHYSAASSQDGSNSEHMANPWKWERFVFVLENGILLPALSVDDLLGFVCVDKMLPQTVVKEILDRVGHLSDRREASFCEWAIRLNDTISTFKEQTSMHDAGGNIEMSSFAVMKSTDETCQELIGNVFDTLWEVTQKVILVTSFSQRYACTDCSLKDEVTDEQRKGWHTLQAERRADQSSNDEAFVKLRELWHVYSKAMEDIYVESANYEKKIEEMTSAQGTIPAMYCSAEIREAYRLLVQAKYRITYHLIDQFQTHLDCQINLLDPLLGKDAAWNVSWFRYLIAQTVFRNHLMDQQVTRRNGKGSTLSFDEMLETVVVAITKWVMESIHQGTIQKLILEHDQRRKVLCGMVEKLLKTAERHFARDDIVQPGHPSSIFLIEVQGLHDDLLKADYTTHLSSFDRSDVLSKLANLRLNLWQRCVLLMATRLHCNECLISDEKATEKHDYGWLSLASTIELPFSLKKGLLFQQTGRSENPCLGGHGSFRAECVLLGLLYRWMDERYKEWQAVVAEQELLVTMSEEKHQASTHGTSGKKNKKKKVPSQKESTLSQETISIVEEDGTPTESRNISEGTADLPQISSDIGHTPAIISQCEEPHDVSSTRKEVKVEVIAKEELPTDVPEQEIQAPLNTISGKKNKKKKLRTKKTSISLLDTTCDDALATEIGPDSLEAADSTVNELHHGVRSADISIVVPIQNGAKKDGKHRSQDIELMEFNKIETESTQLVSSVGIFDGDKFLSAEEFLVARLTNVRNFHSTTAFISS